MANQENKTTGSCLCGAVKYEVNGPLRDVVNCHCSMCRRLHGNYGPHSKAKNDEIDIVKDEGLVWYKTSNIARRGFCRKCGSNLFWAPFDQDATGIVAGTLDDPTILKVIGHIFVDEKADFYGIHDDAPQFSGSSQGKLDGDCK